MKKLLGKAGAAPQQVAAKASSNALGSSNSHSGESVDVAHIAGLSADAQRAFAEMMRASDSSGSLNSALASMASPAAAFNLFTLTRP